jgi:hypothetical protein
VLRQDNLAFAVSANRLSFGRTLNFLILLQRIGGRATSGLAGNLIGGMVLRVAIGR